MAAREDEACQADSEREEAAVREGCNEGGRGRGDGCRENRGAEK